MGLEGRIQDDALIARAIARNSSDRLRRGAAGDDLKLTGAVTAPGNPDTLTLSVNGIEFLVSDATSFDDGIRLEDLVGDRLVEVEAELRQRNRKYLW